MSGGICTVSRRTATLAAVGVLAALVVVPNWKLATMRGLLVPDDVFTSDLMNEGYPGRHYLGQVLRSGELPLWYPLVYGGLPLLGKAETGAAFPVNLLMFGLFPSHVALNLSILLTLLVAATGAYLLAAHLGAGTSGSLVAGVAFAYSGFMVSHLRHLSMAWVVALVPAALLLLLRTLENPPVRGLPPAAVGLAAVIGLQGLAGHPQPLYYSALIYAAVVAAHALRAAGSLPGAPPGAAGGLAAGLRRFAAATRPAVLAGCIGAGLGAVQLVPMLELVRLSARAGGLDLPATTVYAYDPGDLVQFVLPLARGHVGDRSYVGSGIFWEDYAYVGLLTLVAAVYGTVARRREPAVVFIAAGSLLALGLALGPATPLHGLAHAAVPGMRFFRFPTRWLFAVDLGLALLAALGLSHAVRAVASTPAGTRRWAGAALGTLAVAVVTGDLLFHQLGMNPVADARQWLEPPRTARFLREDASLFRIFSPVAADAHCRAFAAAGGWRADLAPYLRHRELLQPCTNVLHGLASADGYAMLVPSYVVDVWGDHTRPGLVASTMDARGSLIWSTAATRKLLDMFNVKYVLADRPIHGPGLEPMYRAPDVHLYRSTGAFERAFLVPAARVVASPGAAAAALLAADFDPAQEAVLFEEPGLPAGAQPGGRADVVRHAANEVRVRVATSQPQLLVLADTFYPGWEARVDGRRTRVLQANLCQRAVVVPCGTHEVTFRYRPRSALLGAALSTLSLALLAVLGRRARPFDSSRR
ncbi:MAG TPA: hypothetical protein P5234_02320 [Thermoanaerobaculaceae bacterium]|nr:hypothetical protein [Thermoanaerobaculaceae bacterium]HRS15062.1 hypothetical protein [Thermoanaerobaculaceae bacterium]